jgi:hypothetical protein
MANNRRKRRGRRAGSHRICAGCRQRRPESRLLRLVRGADGQVLPDLSRKLPGRGAHLCPDRRCFERAVERRAFARAFRADVIAPDPQALADAFAAAGEQRVASMLAVAGRSGWLQVGRDAVRLALRRDRSALVLLALDASAGLVEQVGREARARHVPLRRLLKRRSLGRILGRRELAVVAVSHRGLAARLRLEIDRIPAPAPDAAQREGSR